MAQALVAEGRSPDACAMASGGFGCGRNRLRPGASRAGAARGAE